MIEPVRYNEETGELEDHAVNSLARFSESFPSVLRQAIADAIASAGRQDTKNSGLVIMRAVRAFEADSYSPDHICDHEIHAPFPDNDARVCSRCGRTVKLLPDGQIRWGGKQ